MKCYVFGFIIILFTFNTNAQTKSDYQWIFGSDALTLEQAEGTILDFNGSSRDTVYQQLPYEIGNNNASICDAEGNLLIYSNGCEIYDGRSFMRLNNGDNINPGLAADWNCEFGQYPSPQNSILLPDPSGEGYYYLHKTRTLVEPNYHTETRTLNYSYIQQEGDSLWVSEKNLSFDSLMLFTSSFIESIPHPNGTDWWVIDFTEDVSGGFYLAYLIDSSGIHKVHQYPADNTANLTEWCSSTGQSCFSPDGKTLAKVSPVAGLDVWDFDRNTGHISNYRHWNFESAYHFCGLGISPNSQFAYISATDSLWQIDLTLPNLDDGAVLIADTVLHMDYSFPVYATFGPQQLGPDCKLYIKTSTATHYLHVIHQPDRKGLDCDFEQIGVELPHYGLPGSLPNFPHFRIDEDQLCDPTITNVFELPITVAEPLTIVPNPATDAMTITLPSEVVSSRITITDLDGRVWHSADIVSDTDIVLDTYTYPRGVYIVTITTDDGRRYAERVVLM